MSTPAEPAASTTLHGAPHAGGLPVRAAPLPGATAIELCTRDVVTADESMMVAEAARRMRDGRVGALVVVQEVTPTRRIVTGIVTDRDITTRIVAPERDVHAFRVGDVMTRDLITARPDDTALNLLSLMERKRVRRIPVVGPEAELIGIVALDDLIAAVASQVQGLAGAVHAAQRREV